MAAPGTVHLTKRYADGTDLRDVPLNQRFVRDRERAQARSAWTGDGILRLAPAGSPWSVWLFWRGDTFAGWYVNLETAQARSGHELFTGDHVLDLTIDPDGTIHLKDVDELAAAVEQGRLTPVQAAQITRNGELAAESFARGGWPFDPAWTRWRPDPSWPTPCFGPHERWSVDLLAGSR